MVDATHTDGAGAYGAGATAMLEQVTVQGSPSLQESPGRGESRSVAKRVCGSSKPLLLERIILNVGGVNWEATNLEVEVLRDVPLRILEEGLEPRHASGGRQADRPTGRFSTVTVHPRHPLCVSLTILGNLKEPIPLRALGGPSWENWPRFRQFAGRGHRA